MVKEDVGQPDGSQPGAQSQPRRALKWPALAVGVLLVVALGAYIASGKVGDSSVGDNSVGDTNVGDDGVGDANLPAEGTWPGSPPVKVCDNESILGNGPERPPEGAIVVPAGDNSSVDFGRPGRTYWFERGIHTLGKDEFSQIGPADDSRFVGAPGAVLDGQKLNRYAFSQGPRPTRNVTVEYLTIQNFGPVGGNNNEAVVNQGSGEDWTIRYNTIKDNAGAGVMLASGNVLEYNCLTRNEQYGFAAYSPTGPVGITMDHNEISHNNTYDWETKIEGCGCTGGGKFWDVADATITYNYIHHNKGVGIWADNNNRGFLFENNYISENEQDGIIYETSYNAVIRHNAFVRNALVGGPGNPSFPTGGVYISESGADRRVDSKYSRALEITANLFKDNWSGVVLWENADRYCGSPANTSTGECTLVNPGVVTAKSCNPANIATEPYYSDCRWRTQNVEVHDNTFEHDPAAIGPNCTFENSCGVSGVFSNWGTYPDWSPYTEDVIQKAITHDRGNTFHDNTYRGDWQFLPFEQGNLKTFEEWQADPFRQDGGSTLAPSP